MSTDDYTLWAKTKMRKFPDEGLILAPGKATLLNAAVGFAAEAAEVLDLVKKHIFHGHPLTSQELEKLLYELGDARFYQAILLDALGHTLLDAERANQHKLNERYSKGFSTEESMKRRDNK